MPRRPGGRRARHDGGMVIPGAVLRLSGRPLPVVGPARVYVCGITPYDVTHLGHAATFVWSDVAAAVLRLAGVEVAMCRNVTDVDDVLTRAADTRGRAYDEFALYQEYLFEKDMSALGVHRPAHEPRARHHVTHVQQLAAALLATGHAYERDGYVYFRGAGTVDRAGLTRADALALAEEFDDDPGDPRRDEPFDVPVWRPSSGNQPAWPSPWGPGRHGRGGQLGGAVRPGPPARRRGTPGRREDGQVHRQPHPRRRPAGPVPARGGTPADPQPVLVRAVGVPRGRPRRHRRHPRRPLRRRGPTGPRRVRHRRGDRGAARRPRRPACPGGGAGGRWRSGPPSPARSRPRLTPVPPPQGSTVGADACYPCRSSHLW